MNIRKVVAFCAVVLLTAAAGVVALNGVAWGIYEIHPFAQQITRGGDLGGGVAVDLQATASSLPSQVDGAYAIMSSRLDNAGYADAQLIRVGNDTIRAELPINASSRQYNPDTIAQYLAQTGKLEAKSPDGDTIFTGADIRQLYVQTITSGSSAGHNVVTFALNAEATRTFAEASAKYAGQSVTFTLDGTAISRQLLPSTAITNGTGSIDADFTAEEANLLAQQIKNGMLPTTMTVADARAFGPMLGQDAYSTGVLALELILLAVFVVLALRYRLPGLMADLSLLIYVISYLFFLAAIPGIRLTMAGSLGVLFSLGFAIDTDVMMFERMRSEVRDGRTVHLAIKNGFPRAFSAALNAQIAVLVGAFLLLFIGSSTVAGFAATLTIGLTLAILQGLLTRGLVDLVQFYPVMKKTLFVPAKLLPAAKAN